MTTAAWRPDLAFQVAFNANPNDAAAVPQWVDLSSLLLGGDQVQRGQQYELATNLGAQPTVTLLDPNEYLNPANTLSPYAAGILPYRQVLWQAMYPNGGTGNLLNTGAQGTSYDPSFESYTVGSAVPWLASRGGTTPLVASTTPHTGSRDVSWTTSGAAAGQGVQWTVPCIPGRRYTTSAWVQQSTGSTQTITVFGSPAVNVNPTFTSDISDWTGSSATLVLSPLYPYQGQYSMRLTPSGAATVAANTSTKYAVLVGGVYTAAAQVWCPAGWSDVRTAVDWYDGGGVFLSTSLGSGTSVPAATWTSLSQTFTAPASAAGAVLRVRMGSTPPASTLLYVGAAALTPQTSYQGSTTTATGSWQRLTISWTATDVTHTVAVQTTGTTIPGTVLLDDVQHEPGNAASTFTTSGPVISGVFRGLVERWPTEWVQDTQGNLGLCQATLVDAFAPLNKITLKGEYAAALLALDPDYYWPLGDGSNAVTFGEQSGNSGPPLTARNSKYGAGATFSAGAATNIPGDLGGTGVSINSGVAAANSPITVAQSGLTGPGISVGSAGGWTTTMALWVAHSPSTAAATFATFDAATGTGGGAFQATAPTVSFGNASVTDTWADGRPHLFVGVRALSAVQIRDSLYVDGTLAASTTVGAASIPVVSTRIQVGGYIAPTGATTPGLVDGVYAHVALWRSGLSAGQVANLYQAGIGYPGETSGARISRYLGYGWTGLTSIAAGQSVMGVSDLSPGTVTLAACQGVTTTENGNFWVDSRGYLTFTARTAQYLTVGSEYTFGENTAGGEYPYQDGIAFDFDPTLLYDTVTVTNFGGPEVGVTSPAAVAKFFPNSYPRSIDVQDPNEVYDAANYFLNQYGQPRLRVAQVVLDPTTWPVLWPVVLAVEVGTRVTVKRRAKAGNSGLGVTMSADYFVSQISHGGIDLAAGSWKTTLLLSPVSLYQVGILDDATYGKLDSTMILAY